MDRFKQLQAFVRTAERGSQSAAGRELGITPAMVGRTLRALEDRLGVRLLHRTTTRQSLTPAGAAFHAGATAVLDALDAAERTASELHAEPHGTLRVNAPMSFGVRHLAAALAAFGAVHPRVRVELVLNDRVVDLVEEGYDVAVRIGTLRDSTLVARRLAPCRMVVCASPDYLRRRGAPAVPDDLRGHDCLLYAYSPGTTWTLGGQGVPVSGPLVANNGDALLEAALAGQGVILQPSFIVGDALRGGGLVPLLPDWPVRDLHVHAVYPAARNLSPKVRAFVDFVAARFASIPWDARLPLPSGEGRGEGVALP